MTWGCRNPAVFRRAFCALFASRSFLPGRSGWFCGGAVVHLAFLCSFHSHRNHSPTLITVRCSFSTIHCKSLSQTLLPCYPSACSPSSILAGLLSRADLRFLFVFWLTAFHGLSKLQSWSGYPASPEHLGALGWSCSQPFPYLVASFLHFVASSFPKSFICNTYGILSYVLQTKDLRAA